MIGNSEQLSAVMSGLSLRLLGLSGDVQKPTLFLRVFSASFPTPRRTLCFSIARAPLLAFGFLFSQVFYGTIGESKDNRYLAHWTIDCLAALHGGQSPCLDNGEFAHVFGLRAIVVCTAL